MLSSWYDDPWVRGSYSARSLSSPLRDDDLLKPIGPLYFAGEHTAGDWHGLMEGALGADGARLNKSSEPPSALVIEGRRLLGPHKSSRKNPLPSRHALSHGLFLCTPTPFGDTCVLTVSRSSALDKLRACSAGEAGRLL